MTPKSRERVAVCMFAGIALAVVAAGAVISRCNRSAGTPLPPEAVVFSADSLSSGGTYSDTDRKGKKHKKKSKGKRGSGKRKSSRSKGPTATPPRDYLHDTIPTAPQPYQ